MATITTKEVDIHAFQAGILIAEVDLLSPVVIHEERSPDTLQTLKDVFVLMKRHLNWWASYAGPAGIGQYSLITGMPAGVLARVDSYFRKPSVEEMWDDFQHFGEQVMGPPVLEVPTEQREQYKKTGIFQFLGDDFYFSGPPRIDRTVFLTRVFPGILPSGISELIRDIEGISETGEMIVTQGYHLLHAVDDRIRYLPFKKAINYDPTKFTDFGQMRMERKRLLFYPAGEDEPVNFTQDLFKQ